MAVKQIIKKLVKYQVKPTAKIYITNPVTETSEAIDNSVDNNSEKKESTDEYETVNPGADRTDGGTFKDAKRVRNKKNQEGQRADRED